MMSTGGRIINIVRGPPPTPHLAVLLLLLLCCAGCSSSTRVSSSSADNPNPNPNLDPYPNSTPPKINSVYRSFFDRFRHIIHNKSHHSESDLEQNVHLEEPQSGFTLDDRKFKWDVSPVYDLDEQKGRTSADERQNHQLLGPVSGRAGLGQANVAFRDPHSLPSPLVGCGDATTGDAAVSTILLRKFNTGVSLRQVSFGAPMCTTVNNGDTLGWSSCETTLLVAPLAPLLCYYPL